MDFNYIMDLLTRNQWVLFIIVMSLIILIFVIRGIIDMHFKGGIHNFFMKTYLLYMPIGLFMVLYYLILTKELNDIFAAAFIGYSILIYVESFIEKAVKDKKSRISDDECSHTDLNNSIEQQHRLQGWMLVMFFIIIPMTVFSFLKLVISWLL